MLAILRTLYCTFVLILTSCASTPERNAANTNGVIPHEWTAATRPSSAHIMGEWVSSFADPALTALVNDALNNNFDLKAAAARVNAALEQTIIAGAGRWPQMAFATGYHPTGSGAREGEIRLNEALTKEALNQYRSTALNAFREVEQTLAAEQWLRR